MGIEEKGKTAMRLTARTKFYILLFDLLLFFLSLSFSYFLRLQGPAESILMSTGFWVIALANLASLYIFGTYDVDKNAPFLKLVSRLILAFIASSVVVLSIHYLAQKDRSGIFGRGVFLGAFSVYFLLLVFFRSLLWQSFQKSLHSLKFLFITTTQDYPWLEKDLIKNQFSFSKEFFLIDDYPEDQFQKSLNEKLESKQWNIVMALKAPQISQQIADFLFIKKIQGFQFFDLISFYDVQWRKLPIFFLEHPWFILSRDFERHQNPILLRWKRVLDIGLAMVLLLLALPLMLFASIVIALDSPGPIFFRQVRTGKDGKDFWIYKFRSMRQDAEKNGAQWAQQKDPRITRVGGFLRSTRIDELPQLWNVLTGDMSFIGPRPERPEFNIHLENEIPYYHLRHLIRPGVTGWAQVRYPYGASVEDAKEKLQFDLYYLQNMSFWMDLTIILKTVNVVLFGKGR